ncbi:histidine-rich glycoprotein-like [Cylas formicarius]|uniref:histidine-rich glycoprotein-like n=1 Tax=Cylas formicarius TaxID=197179 RepID=UPI00295883E2|nr:histidine-rich glycoprotein-like [Cylas formicarius]
MGTWVRALQRKSRSYLNVSPQVLASVYLGLALRLSSAVIVTDSTLEGPRGINAGVIPERSDTKLVPQQKAARSDYHPHVASDYHGYQVDESPAEFGSIEHDKESYGSVDLGDHALFLDTSGYNHYQSHTSFNLEGPKQLEVIKTDSYHKEVPSYDTESFQKIHHGGEEEHAEVHYHQHKHLHKHKHKQEHSHNHKDEHKHDHGHKHQHKQHHQHKHEQEHQHYHLNKHHHQHKSGHLHKHEQEHNHYHKSSHKHDHKHKAEHKHQAYQYHKHEHKDEHKHKHDQDHKHGHHHSHKHWNEHKHEEHHKHDYKSHKFYLCAKSLSTMGVLDVAAAILLSQAVALGYVILDPNYLQNSETDLEDSIAFDADPQAYYVYYDAAPSITTEEPLFQNIYVMPRQNSDAPIYDGGESHHRRTYEADAEASEYSIGPKKKKNEIHYHQHKHLHEHEHQQEHHHKHLEQHQEHHGHEHDHDQHHRHYHEAKHEHKHDGEHWHKHEGQHKHQHLQKHQHKHESGHKHEHDHDEWHQHHEKHQHAHDHEGKHYHEQWSKHNHDHHHDHKEEGKHDHKHHHGHAHKSHVQGKGKERIKIYVKKHKHHYD